MAKILTPSNCLICATVLLLAIGMPITCLSNALEIGNSNASSSSARSGAHALQETLLKSVECHTFDVFLGAPHVVHPILVTPNLIDGAARNAKTLNAKQYRLDKNDYVSFLMALEKIVTDARSHGCTPELAFLKEYGGDKKSILINEHNVELSGMCACVSRRQHSI